MRSGNTRSNLLLLAALLVSPLFAFAQGSYKKPDKAILDVLNAPAIPTTLVSPTHDRIALLEPLRYPPISELAQPMLRIAGLRINPNTNGQHRQAYSNGLKLKNVSDGKEITVTLPAGAQIISPAWSPDGKSLAAGNVTPTGVEIWIIDTTSGKAQKIKGAYVNTAFGGFSWEDSKTILATLVPAKRGAAPNYQNLTPTEPSIQETRGRTGAVQTFQDLLKS
ncbi:MAG: S9 family peptidase, partial [Pyrinomonadaceae bacterium]